MSTEEEMIVSQKKKRKNKRPSRNSVFNENRNWKYSIRKETATTLEEQISMQFGLNLITKHLKN